MWVGRIVRTLLRIAIALLAGVLVSATLIRSAPGFNSDERLLDSRLSAQTVATIRSERAANDNVFRFYGHYLSRSMHGDLGMSESLGRPVSELIRDRLPSTLKLAGIGLLLAWGVALGSALIATAVRSNAVDLSATAIAGTFLCIPSAVLALATAAFRTPASLAIALIVFPRIFRYARNLLERSYGMPHVLTARVKGISEVRILFWHVLPTSLPQLLALAGVSVSIAFGACIPVETLCGTAGVGQLAWQAALGRDLPLLVTVTVIVTAVTLGANAGSDLLNEEARPQEG